MTQDQGSRPPEDSRARALGFAIGLMAGAVLTALTRNAVWIAIGPVIGAAVGATRSRARDQG